MITVRTRRKIGMMQQQLSGAKEEDFLLTLGQNFLEFIHRYGTDNSYADSLICTKIAEYVKDKNYAAISDLFAGLQVFGTYDKYTQLTTKYKIVSSAVGRNFNGTVFEGRPDEQSELNRIIAHTCGMCTEQGTEFVEKLLA